MARERNRTLPHQSFQPGARADATVTDVSICFVFRRSELLIRADRSPDSLPRFAELGSLDSRIVRLNYIGLLDDQPSFAIEVHDETPDPDQFVFTPLRAAFGPLDDAEWLIAARAAQVVEWDRTHQFCGRCGSATDYQPDELGKRCPNCGLVAFPRVSPAVIVLVERGNDVLLARGAHLATGTYALIAGFVEVGETLEDAVHREIREEVGIEVEDIRYFGSQPWPFPHSIMLGFTAQYKSGDIHIEPNELEDAQFFSPHSLPQVPPRLSIARKLIDFYAGKHGIDLND